MNELKTYVERVVRPIRANSNRKFQMREELYSHLETQYTQELENCGNEQQAMTTTINRFGSSAELTEELQQTISRFERFGGWFERWLQRKPNESLIYFAGRLALFSVLFFLLQFTFFGLICFLLSDTELFQRSAANIYEGRGILGAVVFCFGINTFSFTLITNPTFHKVKNAPFRQFILQAISAGLLCAFSFVGSIILLCFGFLTDPIFTADLVEYLCLSLFWIPIVYSFALWAACLEWKKYAPWETLVLE